MRKSNKRKRKQAGLPRCFTFIERDVALARVVAAWEKGEAAGEDELNQALDALAVTHIAATFEWASGPLKW
jgi:hypothetical protein